MRWRDCIERDTRKAELEDVDWRMLAQDRAQWRMVGRQRRVATLTPEIRETRKRERSYPSLY